MDGYKMTKETKEVSDDPIRILTIEDNPGDYRLLQEALGTENPTNFEMVRAESLSEGLQQLSSNRYDVLLLDLTLPDSHGFNTFRKIQKSFPEISIVVLTGNDDEGLAVTAVQEGAQDYLVKGQFEGKLLVRSIRYAYERMRAEKALRKANTLKNIQQLAAAISHEFSQPLQTLSGCLSILNNENKKKSDAEYLEVCQRMVQRITELLMDLRNITELKKQKYLNSQILDIRASAEEVGTAPENESKRILIVDDEEDLVELLVEKLKMEGYTCDGAKDGLEALNLIHEHQYDLVISDINMPRMPGTTLFKIIKSIKYSCQFVFLTGYAVPGEIESIVNKTDGLLSKPVDFTYLSRYVAKLLDGKNGKIFSQDKENLKKEFSNS
jgi:CheY-like chemotaxis protein